MSAQEQQIVMFLVIVLIWAALKYPRPWRGSGTAHGTARFANKADLKHGGFFSGKGLLLGRAARSTKLITIPNYTHLAVFAPTGAGKGVSIVLPTLLTYRRGAVFCFDPKGENFRIASGARRAMGDRVIRLDPFGVCGPGGDCWNPLDSIQAGPTLVDECRALAESMVVRAPEGDKDPHWNNSAAALLSTMITATLLYMERGSKTLDTCREMITDRVIYKEVITRMQAVGGIPARLANALAKQSESEKEIAGVISTCNTHTAFLDSELVAAMLGKSTFSADVLLQPGTTVFLILPVEHFESQARLLRLLVSSFIRFILRNGMKTGGETLLLIDECSALGTLDALEQAFVLGRGAGIRLLTFWQSIEQAQVAFRQKPNLIADNSDQVYFGTNTFATADLVSKTLGTHTLVTASASYNASESTSHTPGSQGPTRQSSWSTTENLSEISRSLLQPSEILQMNTDFGIALIKGTRPILFRRIKYYSDPLFKRARPIWKWVLAIALLALVGWLAFHGRFPEK